MILENLRKDNIKGSSLTFSAQGGRGKEKIVSAEKPFAEARTARQEGVGGGMPSRPSEVRKAPAACSFRAGHHRKVLFSF